MKTKQQNNKSTKLKALLFGAVALCAALPMMASADEVIVNNLANTGEGSTSIGTEPFGPPPNPTIWGGQQFTTPSGGDLTLGDVTMLLTGPSSGTNQFTVSLYSNSSGLPGSSIAALATESDTTAPFGSFENVTITPGSDVTLDPSTTYWIVLSSIEPAGVQWSFAYSGSTNGTGTMGENAVSQDGGGSWSGFGVYFNMKVQATAVPEPSTYALLGLAALALVSRFTLRRRAKLQGSQSL